MLDEPVFEARGVRLRTLGSTDYEPLLHIEGDPSLILRWRHEGQTPTPEKVRGGMIANQLCAFIVENARTEQAVGLAVVHDANFAHRRALMSTVCFEPDSSEKRLETTIGLILTINYAFSTWNLHKLSAGVAEYNLDQFGSELDGLLVEEGRLRDHVHLAGGMWSWVMLAVFRSDWAAAAGLLDRAFGLPPIAPQD